MRNLTGCSRSGKGIVLRFDLEIRRAAPGNTVGVAAGNVRGFSRIFLSPASEALRVGGHEIRHRPRQRRVGIIEIGNGREVMAIRLVEEIDIVAAIPA